jgi:hypothetical protein
MFEIWANLTLIFGAFLVAAFLWFVLTILGKSIFEDLLGSLSKKVRRRRERDRDHYVY